METHALCNLASVKRRHPPRVVCVTRVVYAPTRISDSSLLFLRRCHQATVLTEEGVLTPVVIVEPVVCVVSRCVVSDFVLQVAVFPLFAFV